MDQADCAINGLLWTPRAELAWFPDQTTLGVSKVECVIRVR
jgi:hypothetical protein